MQIFLYFKWVECGNRIGQAIDEWGNTRFPKSQIQLMPGQTVPLCTCCALLSMFWGIFLRFTWASQICGMRKAAFCKRHLYRETLIFILCVCFGLQFPFDFCEPHLENLNSFFKISTLRQVAPHAVMFCG